jgi:hypothetical protein
MENMMAISHPELFPVTPAPASGPGPAPARTEAENTGKARKPKKPRSRWHLLTNQLNLMYLLAAGLVPGPRGFGNKYYQDPLSVAPGWIPLFANAIPAEALAQAVSEAGHLRPVIAELDLTPLRGPVVVMAADGRLREARYPDDLDGHESALFVPAPLPTAWIKALLFSSAADKSASLVEADDYRNVALPPRPAKVKATLFKPKPLRWPPSATDLNSLTAGRDPDLHRVWGIGATLALLSAIANRSDATMSACRLACEPESFDPASSDAAASPILPALYRWVSGSPVTTGDGLQAGMLLATLEAITDEKEAADSDDRKADTRQAVLDYLSAEKARLDDERLRGALDKLDQDLRGVIGFGGDTGGDLLERHAKPYSRALILFFLRDDYSGFLEFDHPLLNDNDRIVAALLFAAATGWRSLANELRDLAGADRVSLLMAAAAQRSGDTGLDLGPAPARRRPLRELLTPGGKGWNNKQQRAALALARGLDWNDLIHTRISLGKGDYQLRIDGSGAHILLDGEVKAVTTSVDRDALLERLSTAAVPAKLEVTVRGLSS